MHTPVALFKFVARAALNAVGGGVLPEEVFALLPEVMLQGGVTNMLPHRFSRTVEGMTGMAWVSFGQRVVAQVRSCSRGSLVTVKSQPHKRLQLYDWDCGKREAQTILQGLADRLVNFGS